MTKRKRTSRIGPKAKNKSFRCDNCRVSFGSLNQLVDHAKLFGNEECLAEIPICYNCDRHFATHIGLTRHLRLNKECYEFANRDDIMNTVDHRQFDNARFGVVQGNPNRCTVEVSTYEEKLKTKISVTQSNTIRRDRIHQSRNISSSNTSSCILPSSVIDSPQMFIVDREKIIDQLSSDNTDGSDSSKLNVDKANFFVEFFCDSLGEKTDVVGPYNLRSFLLHMNNTRYGIMDSTDNFTIPGKEHVFQDFSMMNEVDLYNFLWKYGKVETVGNQEAEDNMVNDAVSLNTNDSSQSEIEFDAQSNELDNNDNLLHDPITVEEDDGIINETMDKMRAEIYSHRREVRDSFTETDIAMLELHELLDKAGAPMYLFDQVTKWSQKHSGVFGMHGMRIPSKKKFATDMASKIYSPRFAKDLEPKTDRVVISPSNNVNLTGFSFTSQLISLLTNEDLMQPENLLLDRNDPLNSIPHHGCFLDDLNSGWWLRETSREICTKDNEILLGIVIFIDSGKVTENMSLEPIVFTLAIFNRETRNKPEAWRTIGYIESDKNYSDQSYTQDNKNTDEKWEAYHKICEKLLSEMQVLLGKDGGFKWTLTLDGKKHEVVFKLAVQVVLGDCEGNKKLCLHFGTTRSKVLCRDCMVPYADADDPNHVCTFTTKQHILGKSAKELAEICKHNVVNAFHPLYYGARELSIYEVTPPEPLHGILLGLVKYQFDKFLEEVPSDVMTLIETSVRYLYKHCSRQSGRDFPTLSSIQNSVQKPGTLSAKEQYARCFGIYLTLLIPSVFESLANTIRRGKNNIALPSIGYDRAKKWFQLFQRTLCMYQWMMKDKHAPHTVRNGPGNQDSPAQKEVRKYMTEYKELIGDRSGAGLKLNKFHQTLHYVRQIQKDGSIQNIDTGRPESNAVTMYKDLAKMTQRRQETIVPQIAQRHYEDLVLADAARILIPNNRRNAQPEPKEFEQGLTGGKYNLTIHFEDGDNIDDEMAPTVDFQWTGVSYNPRLPASVCLALAKRLYFHDGRGGCLSHTSSPTGRTEYIDENGIRYRAHPSYSNNTEWFDWCYIQWDGYSEQYPAKIITFLDLNDCEIIQQIEGEELTGDEDSYLETGEWAVIQSGNEIKVTSDDLETMETLDAQRRNKVMHSMVPSIGKRYKMERSLRIVPVDKIRKPCYCIPDSLDRTSWNIDEFIALDDIRSWHCGFLKEQ